jgi:hypothetical protein
MVKYCLLLGQHILEMTKIEPCSEIMESFEINKKWLNGETGKGFAKFQMQGTPQANFSTWLVMKKIQLKKNFIELWHK